jgi:2-polyprenyl-3-methyl-5-hydroxy-6-metoxy-1,4-benzoquinol methylase
MALDPVERSQLSLRRARRWLRARGALDDSTWAELEGEQRERFFAQGYRQVANLAGEIEAHTGCTLDSRRALDFGCGRGRMAIPLGERCEHVYGVDVGREALRQADSNAKRLNVSNVEWLEANRLDELSGRYDLVVSFWVFQHIPSREGERLFAKILHGLRPGGVGAVHFTLRPSRPASRPDLAYLYLLMNSYSLNRLGGVLADAGVTDWHVNWRTSRMENKEPYPAAIIIFRKDR